MAELEARLAVLDADDHLLYYIGADDVATGRPDLASGFFNSPHGLAVSAHGDPIIAEWLIGGRVDRLTKDPG